MPNKNTLLRAIAAVMGTKDGDEGDDSTADAEVARLLTEAAADPPKESTVSPNPNAAPTPAPAPAPAATAPGFDQAELDRLRSENARLQKSNEDLVMQGINAQAATFAKQIIDIEHKGFPPERDAIAREYAQAAMDDLVLGAAKFTVGDAQVVKTRVQQVEERYAARPQNILTQEQLQAGLHTVLVNSPTTSRQDPNAELSQDKVAELVKMTPLGKSATSTNGSGR